MKQSWLLEKNKKIYKPKLTKRQREREKTQMNTIRSEKWDKTKDTKKMQRIIRIYFKNLYSTKLENLKEMDNFLN